eukprot:TRINITY_DN12330_c0_g1_i4.p1 TRINITY_DN12330_c0_g1~~TRINITY_DN12330_c0_g1_i4.p1  ORF type:complete len:412 (+),score=104.93 TRINITY_DN12330_c0_g1_i4:88-1323(+)
MIRRPPRSTLSSSSAASDVYKRQVIPFLRDVQSRLLYGTYLPYRVRSNFSKIINSFLTFGVSSTKFRMRPRARGCSSPGLPVRFSSEIAATATREEVLKKYWRETKDQVGLELAPTACVWACSDLHTDCRQNMEWLEKLPYCPSDTIIVAGDVATSTKIIEESLVTLTARFQHVFFVPGNHELWNLDKKSNSGSKFFEILSLCDRLGVHTTPKFVGELLVCPLFSWYKGGDEGLGSGEPGALKQFDMQCKWPQYISSGGERNALHPDIAEFFAETNVRVLKQLQQQDRPGTRAVLSFSHFLPYKELFPGLTAMRHVMGCDNIGKQVAECDSDVHVFGHSHLNIDRMINGTRFVQSALGHAGDPGWDPRIEPVLVWDCNATGTILLDMQKEMASGEHDKDEEYPSTPPEKTA